MKYIIQKSENKPNYWVCSDIKNGVVCVFENQNFNENQNFTLLENFEKPNANELAKIVNEMAEWLRENHYSKILPCSFRLDVGLKLKKLRENQGYSLKKMQDLTGLDESNISKIEHGRYNTGVDLIGKILDALDCDIDFVSNSKSK